MSVADRLATLAVAISVLTPMAANAMDDFIAASSRAPTGIVLCGDGDRARIKNAACKQAGYDRLVTQIDAAFGTALARLPATIKPLLKRDQTWFNEVILEAADSEPESDDPDISESFAQTFRQRLAALNEIAASADRAGIGGRWLDAFGSVVVTPADSGGFRLAVDMRAVYGTGSDRRRECRLDAVVKPDSTGWLTGPVLPEAAKPLPIKIRRQGETLRVVLSDTEEGQSSDRADCNTIGQITGSYFAAGKPDAAAADKTATGFVVPSFDCSRPNTAADEEICADPDLAENDQRLNRAWKALLPRLDETTRRALTEDQRKWVGSQAVQYPEFLHPAWNKQTSQMHYTGYGRDQLDRLQRERIALLDGFDDKRSGLAGTWLAYNAVIQVTANKDGSLSAKGWKWDQGDWKAGCDYEMEGKMVGGVFRSDDQRRNPDTLERDHAILIVNRFDDVFAKKRWKQDGTADDKADEAKCRRNLQISSTARLFPARPSADIDNLGGGSIR